ncbi:MAG: redoxin domain-containing protein [Zavarzinella sp.]|nr:redoxin domain-containing protein [Zavarzinella sp.]
MRRIPWVAGVLLAASPAGGADAPVEKINVPPRVVTRIEWIMPRGNPAEQVKQIIDRQKQLQDAFWKKYKAAKSEAEKERLGDTEFPEPDEPAKLLLEIAAKHPKDPVAFDALLWAVQKAPAPPNKADAPFFKARDTLMRDFARHPRIGELCRALSYEEHDLPAIAFVRDVYEKHPDAAARAQAGLALANLVRRNAAAAAAVQKTDNDSAWAKPYGQKYVDYLRSADPVAMNKEVEAVLEHLAADKELAKITYERGDKTRTIGDAADAELFELRNLQPGKPAPEITGEDIDGKAFKLSDYRGKVVLLDFWGDW